MGKTNDFGAWLSNVALQGDQEVYDLYNSVSNFEGTERFYTDKEIKNDGAR